LQHTTTVQKNNTLFTLLKASRGWFFKCQKGFIRFSSSAFKANFVFGFVFLFSVGKPKRDTFSKAMNATIFF